MDHNIHREISRTLPGNGHSNILPQLPTIQKEIDLQKKKPVRTLKRIREETRINGKNPYISLLKYRNTPTDDDCPAQFLMSTQLISILPISKEQLKPKVIPAEKTYEKRRKSQY